MREYQEYVIKCFLKKKLTTLLSSDIKKIYKIRENVNQPTDPIF